MFLLDRVSCPDTEIQVLRKEKNSYQRATYEDPRFPSIRDTSAALKIQASYFDKPFVTTRPTQDEYVKNGPRRT